MILPPEGDHSSLEPKRTCTQWGHDPDGQLCQLDNAHYNCSTGRKQVPAYRLSRKRLKYCQQMKYKQEKGDRALNAMILEEDLPSIEDVTQSPLAKCIHFAENSCG